MPKKDHCGRADKGSRFHLQNLVRDNREWLNCLILSASPSLREFVDGDPTWVSPLEKDDYCEYQDREFLDKLGFGEHWEELQKFWPQNGPVWDALATIKAKDGTSGVILLEAKSHADELRGGGCGAKDAESITKIEDSLGTVKEALGVQGRPDWLGPYYQYANRVAHLYFLNKIVNVPTWLIFLYFVGDTEMDGPEMTSGWNKAIAKMKAALGLTDNHLLHDGIAAVHAPGTDVSRMKGPQNKELPFFSYGVFRKGELGFLSIRDLVRDVRDSVSTKGTVLLRDGLPILDRSGDSDVEGSIIHFKNGCGPEAYRRINRLEPDRQYSWQKVEVDQNPCNCLVGKSPNKGTVAVEGEWKGRDDPLFDAALDVVENTLHASMDFEWDLKPMFRLEMAYLLLWSSIERYASLRYHLRENAANKVMQISEEPEFQRLLKERIKRGTDRVYRVDKPQDYYELDPTKPRRCLEYYYQIRCNITHRGKGVPRDHDRVRDSLAELLGIFRSLLEAAYKEASDWEPDDVQDVGVQ